MIAKVIIRFLKEDVICRYRVVSKFKVNEGPKFKGVLITKLKRLEIC